MTGSVHDKAWFREQAKQARRKQPERECLSAQIVERLGAVPEYQQASMVLWYLGVRDEVATLPGVVQALREGRQIVVPYCSHDEHGEPCLKLWRLQALDELTECGFGLLEPKAMLREMPTRCIAPKALDVVLVPGLAFDAHGGRLGYGAGYYDRLLARLRPEAVTIGLAFECQRVAQVPMAAHDVPLDCLVTEAAVYRGRGRL
ncbi:MAG: 5-formyltetrahydrofolate cyclo-ligase [Methylococcales bacterium]|nr:5-formyltetrahydrofolate cyclo-ligase [Methylococcales bacterium]